MYIDKHQDRWNELHQLNTFRPRFPSESIIRFIRKHFPVPQDRHILDLGCGSGRHTVCLAREGFDVTGIDLSGEGLAHTRQRLAEEGLEAALVQGSILELPFGAAAFDGIISYGVLCYLVPADLTTAAQEIYRCLKPGGTAFLVVRSVHDKRYGRGEEVAPHTFRMTDNRTNEKDMVIHFMDPGRIRELFSAFTAIEIGFEEESMNSLTAFNSDYLITLIK
ncbi:class I SAM-dependent methyltransferase [Paenibacillus sp. y28]|uniref:class I SAM-dependent methyltransferase n=1 Tax=Paenibacillus sp. y28 TaxID=3129110 RepID=UPI00301AF2B0